MCRAKNVLCKPYLIGLVLGLATLLSAWTCTAVVNLNGCPDAFPHLRSGHSRRARFQLTLFLSC
jgi:hypothetical protein